MMWFEAKLSHLDRMLAYVRDQAAMAGLSRDKAHRVEVCCEEAIVNIISYAFDEKAPPLLHISCEKKGGRFITTLKDHGKPFNPIESDIDPQLDMPLSERELGGLGIYLIRKLMDESVYQRLGDQNVLRMSLNLS
jgi:serine/threonine-protein kinase RsbW